MDDDVVALARGWIGTPYRHQASRRGAGADCLGLIRGIWRERYGSAPEVPPAYGEDWGEFGPETLLAAMARHCPMLAADAPWQAGQILLFRMRQGAAARHLAILSAVGAQGAVRIIHAYQRHGVVESPLSAPWRGRVAARFRFP